MPFGFFVGGLAPLGKEISAEILDAAEAFFLGAKDFRAPKGLGGVRSRFCYVVVLGKRHRLNPSVYFGTPAFSSPAGSPVWKRAAPPMEGDPDPGFLYVAQVDQNYFLVFNDLQEFQTVAETLRSSEKSPILAEIRQWGSVVRHEMWAYRRYRHSGSVDRIAAGMEDVTPGAEALILLVDFKKRVCMLRLLLGAPGDERTPAKMNARATLPQLGPGGPGIWQATISLAGDEKTFERMFVIMGLFGFAVYL
jgi:hypothetical protein